MTKLQNSADLIVVDDLASECLNWPGVRTWLQLVDIDQNPSKAARQRVQA